MAADCKKNERPDEPGKKPSDQKKETEACRCKEASEMTPGELLKLAISDLAFWRKPKQGQ